MKKMLLGLAAVFALSAAIPAYAADEGAGTDKPAKETKSKGKKKGGKKDKDADKGAGDTK